MKKYYAEDKLNHFFYAQTAVLYTIQCIVCLYPLCAAVHIQYSYIMARWTQLSTFILPYQICILFLSPSSQTAETRSLLRHLEYILKLVVYSETRSLLKNLHVVQSGRTSLRHLEVWLKMSPRKSVGQNPGFDKTGSFQNRVRISPLRMNQLLSSRSNVNQFTSLLPASMTVQIWLGWGWGCGQGGPCVHRCCGSAPFFDRILNF